MLPSNAIKYKCCFIGKFSVGKTSIIECILNKKSENPRSTLGIDFFTKTLYVKNERRSITLWDTAGAERYRSLTTSYIRGSDIIFIVYDVSDFQAMFHVRQSLKDIECCNPGLVAIIGNKYDLNSDLNHRLDDEIAPYRRQGWRVETAICSVYNDPDGVKAFFKKCLHLVVKPTKRNIEVASQFKMESNPEMSRKCCT